MRYEEPDMTIIELDESNVFTTLTSGEMGSGTGEGEGGNAGDFGV